MKVLVCGASGFIGEAIASRLTRDGHDVVRGVRHPARQEDVAIDYANNLSAHQWLDKLDGVDAVINAVGIIVERGRQSFDHVHAQAPIALFTACAVRGVRHVIQISALGAESRETPYFASKCATDDFLLAQRMQTHVIRPALVYGTEGTSARLFRTLASFPVHVLPAGGHQALRPVHVDDLAEVVARLLGPNHDAAKASVIDVVGGTVVTYRQMLDVYRRSMRFAPAFTVGVPAWVMSIASRLANWIPGSTLTPDTWHMLQRGNTADVEQTTQALGRAPRAIEAFIEPDSAPGLRAETLASWRGLVLRIALAIVWIGTAIVSAAAYPRAESLALLARVGLHGTAADVTLYGACALDFALGIATLLTPGRGLWLLQIMVMLGYSAIIAVALPEFLIEPFGPILKNVPILAVLILLFSEETPS